MGQRGSEIMKTSIIVLFVLPRTAGMNGEVLFPAKHTINYKAKIQLYLFYVKTNYYHFLRLHIDL